MLGIIFLTIFINVCISLAMFKWFANHIGEFLEQTESRMDEKLTLYEKIIRIENQLKK
jgi:hypothetical protein